MKTNVLVFLAVDLALLLGVFLMLAKILRRLDEIERRLDGRRVKSQQKSSSGKRNSRQL